MTDTVLLKYELAKRHIKVSKVCEVLGISEPTYYRKINGDSDFTRTELMQLIELADFNGKEVSDIFFAGKLT